MLCDYRTEHWVNVTTSLLRALDDFQAKNSQSLDFKNPPCLKIWFSVVDLKSCSAFYDTKSTKNNATLRTKRKKKKRSQPTITKKQVDGREEKEVSQRVMETDDRATPNVYMQAKFT